MIVIRVIVEFQVEPEMEIVDFDPQDILNHDVKVKSGKYENAIVGTITDILTVAELP